MKEDTTSYNVSNSVAAKLSTLFCNKFTAGLMPNVELDVANKQETFQDMLNWTETHSLRTVAVLRMQHSELLECLSTRGIIFKSGRFWRPTARFRGKNLFHPANGGKELQTTFLGECFICLVISNPAFSPAEIFNRFFKD